MSGLLVLGLFVVLLILGLPLAYSMAIPALIYIFLEGVPIDLLAHRMTNSLNSFTLVAIPLFILAGNLMNVSGMTDRIFDFVMKIIGRVRGGLAQVDIMTSLIFSGMSGSALADIGGFGKILMHAMKKAGYRDRDAAGVTAASATVGAIFPPSIPIIIFAVVAEVSAVHMLMAGVIPALIFIGLLAFQVWFMAVKYKWPKIEEKTTLKEKSVSFLKALPALTAPVILIAGLTTGIFGPTEVSAFTVFYIVVLGKFVYRELTWKKILVETYEAVKSSALILFIVSAASIFAWVLTVTQVSNNIADALLSVSSDPTVLLFMSVILLLVLGMFMETIAAILIVTPILLPVLTGVGVSPIQTGMVIIFTMMIGLLTPPVGMSLFMIANIKKMPVEEVIKGTLPYYIVLFLTLALIVLVPSISTWLPDFIYNK